MSGVKSSARFSGVRGVGAVSSGSDFWFNSMAISFATVSPIAAALRDDEANATAAPGTAAASARAATGHRWHKQNAGVAKLTRRAPAHGAVKKLASYPPAGALTRTPLPRQILAAGA